MTEISEKSILHQQHTSTSRCSINSEQSCDSKSEKSFRSDKYGQRVGELERNWFLSSAKCDGLNLKSIFSEDKQVINKKDIITFAALHWVAKKGRSDLIGWFVESGADINIRTKGYTALHIAAMQGKEKTVCALVDLGADVSMRDYSGRQACHYLPSNAGVYIRELLQSSHVETCLDLHLRNSEFSIPSLIGSISMPLIGSVVDLSTNTEHHGSERKKKRSISIAQSFRHKKKEKKVEKHGIHRSVTDVSISTMTQQEKNLSPKTSPIKKRRSSTMTQQEVVRGLAITRDAYGGSTPSSLNICCGDDNVLSNNEEDENNNNNNSHSNKSKEKNKSRKKKKKFEISAPVTEEGKRFDWDLNTWV